jgi:hypothetical protein
VARGFGCRRATLMPLNEAIRAHVFAADRIHADDTIVPVLARGKTRTGRLWTYVRDERPFGGRAPLAAICFYSADRRGEHPEQHLANYAALMQADAYADFNRKNWTFAGSDEGGRRAAAVYTLIATAKLNDVDPQAWLTNVLARINDHNIHSLGQLLP